MITKQMGLMDFSKSADELERLVRGMNPWPSAYTYLNGKTLKVWRCEVVQIIGGACTDEKNTVEPGTVLKTDKAGIHVACGRDILVLTEVQLEGKKRMESDAFLRGYKIDEGTLLKNCKE